MIDFLNLYLTGNNMGREYKAHLLSLSTNSNYWMAFDGVEATWDPTFTDRMERHQFLQKLLYLIITTPEFRVQK